MSLEFSADGSVTILASDVPVTGRYLRSDLMVAVRFRSGDNMYDWEMELSPDGSTLSMVDGDLVLTRWEE